MEVEELSVLLIEDNDDDLLLCELELKKLGITNYDAARNEQEAMGFIEQRAYDLVISDTMYEKDILMGPPVVRKARELGRDLVVIALSSHPENEKYWCGLSDYFFDKNKFYKPENDLLSPVLQEKFQIQLK